MKIKVVLFIVLSRYLSAGGGMGNGEIAFNLAAFILRRLGTKGD